MRESFSGIVNIFFIAIFLVIISGILALIVSYTKAFKMKNIIISTIEQYEGSGCTNDSSYCYKKIQERAKNYRYNVGNLKCPNDFSKVGNLYCIKETHNKDNKYFYTVITRVDFYFPVISDFFSFNFFETSGDTQEIVKPS
jgi:hypothetical protein